MDRRFVCPCGLTCCDCLFHKSELFDAARRLRALIAKHDFDTFLTLLSRDEGGKVIGAHLLLSEDQARDELGTHFDAFKRVPEFLRVLDGIVAMECATTCQEARGCSLGASAHKCGALQCVESRGYDGCWQCGEFEACDKLQFLKRSYGHVIDENLRTIRDHGAEAVKPRGNKYYAWQRRIAGDAAE